MGLHIRPYRPADEELAVAIWTAASAIGHPFLPTKGDAERERQLRETYLVMAENWIGEDDTGRAVGLLGLLNHEDAPCEVGGLFVLPDATGRGYGRALLDHAAALKRALTLEVFELNRNARDFYAHMGFTETSHRVDEDTGLVLCGMARRAFD